MIRVLHVIGVMDRGGAETMIMNLYRAMDRSKIQFDFLVHEQREGDYDAEIRELGGRFFRLPRFNGFNEHSYRRQCRSLFAAHQEWRVVHGHIGSSAPIYLSEAKKAGRYAIAHSHSQNFIGGIMGLAFSMVACPVRYVADYFFACSPEAGKDRFGERIVESARFSVIANGIDLNRYTCNQEMHTAAKAAFGLSGYPVIAHTGRLIPVKNHSFLLDVFKRVHEKLPDAILVCAGRGELEESLRRQADALGVSSSIRFLGVVDDVPSILRAADVFVFPSIKEGLPLAVVEAQASGLSVLMSTGVPESAVVSDRALRMPLDAGADAWSQVVLSWVRKEVSMRTDACEQVRAHGFDIVETAMWLTDFYNQVAESR